MTSESFYDIVVQETKDAILAKETRKKEQIDAFKAIFAEKPQLLRFIECGILTKAREIRTECHFAFPGLRLANVAILHMKPADVRDVFSLKLGRDFSISVNECTADQAEIWNKGFAEQWHIILTNAFHSTLTDVYWYHIHVVWFMGKAPDSK